MAEKQVLQEGLGVLCFLESLQQQTRAPTQAHWKLSRGKLFIIWVSKGMLAMSVNRWCCILVRIRNLKNYMIKTKKERIRWQKRSKFCGLES